MFTNPKETTEKVTTIYKIKKHFKNHKRDYIIAATSIAATAVIATLAASTTEVTTIESSNMTVIQKNRFGKNKSVVINLTERSTPSKPVHLVGTNLYFDSMSDAARKTGHHLSMISKHINGQIPDLNGDVFELLTAA